MKNVKRSYNKILGFAGVPLEGRYSYTKTRETNMANFYCDYARIIVEADCGIFNAGTLKIGSIF